MKTIGYKLTDENDQTYGSTQWGPNITHETDGSGKLCGSGWLHYYRSPLLAVLHDPIHGVFGITAKLWECTIEGETIHDGWMKSGCTRLTTIRRIQIPVIATDNRVTYAIICAQKVIRDLRPTWSDWADRWLSGKDRTWPSAAREAIRTMTWAEEAWASEARAARTAEAWASKAAETWAAMRTIRAWVASAEAAREAQTADKTLDLSKIAEKAMKEE